MIVFYYINLNRSADRRERLLRQFSKNNVNFVRVEAIDGKDHNFKGTVNDACLLSHVKAINAFYQSGDPIGIICEDDLSFEYAPFWEVPLETIIKEAPPKWDVLQLAVLVDQYYNEMLKKKKERYQSYFGACSALAYAITRECAQRKLLEYGPLEEISLLYRFPEQFVFFNNPNVYTVYPPPFTFPFLNDSLLHHSHVLSHMNSKWLIDKRIIVSETPNPVPNGKSVSLMFVRNLPTWKYYHIRNCEMILQRLGYIVNESSEIVLYIAFSCDEFMNKKPRIQFGSKGNVPCLLDFDELFPPIYQDFSLQELVELQDTWERKKIYNMYFAHVIGIPIICVEKEVDFVLAVLTQKRIPFTQGELARMDTRGKETKFILAVFTEMPTKEINDTQNFVEIARGLRTIFLSVVADTYFLPNDDDILLGIAQICGVNAFVVDGASPDDAFDLKKNIPVVLNPYRLEEAIKEVGF